MAIQKPAPSDVIALTGTELPEAVVQSLIDDAALMVSKCIESLEPERQAAIVKWVAAHLVSSGPDRYASLTSEKLGDASESYATAKLGDSLAGSLYGQQAIALDPNGCIARLGRARASIEVV